MNRTLAVAVWIELAILLGLALGKLVVIAWRGF